MKKVSEINISGVSDEQIGKCFKIFGPDGKAFYQVESESGPEVYNVRWSKEHGFTCTCPAGAIAFTHCKDGVCKHVKWSLAAAREEREALAELSANADRATEAEAETPAASLLVDGKPADQATLHRVYTAKPTQVSKRRQAPMTRPFSLLR